MLSGSVWDLLKKVLEDSFFGVVILEYLLFHTKHC